MTEPQDLKPVIGVEADDLIVPENGARVEALGVGHMMLDEVDLHVEVLRHGNDALGRLGGSFLRSRFNTLHSFIRVQGGGAVAPAHVHRNRGDGGNQGLCEVAQGLIAGDHGHGDTVVARGIGIEQEFTFTANWHLCSGLSLILMIFILISMFLIAKYDKEGNGTAF